MSTVVSRAIVQYSRVCSAPVKPRKQLLTDKSPTFTSQTPVFCLALVKSTSCPLSDMTEGLCVMNKKTLTENMSIRR